MRNCNTKLNSLCVHFIETVPWNTLARLFTFIKCGTKGLMLRMSQIKVSVPNRKRNNCLFRLNISMEWLVCRKEQLNAFMWFSLRFLFRAKWSSFAWYPFCIRYSIEVSYFTLASSTINIHFSQISTKFLRFSACTQFNIITNWSCVTENEFAIFPKQYQFSSYFTSFHSFTDYFNFFFSDRSMTDFQHFTFADRICVYIHIYAHLSINTISP